MHRWFRLTPSFGPALVRGGLEEMETPEGATILDPFLALGRHRIECSLEGFRCFGFEINPFLHFVCKTSTNWDLSTGALRTEFDKITNRFDALSHSVISAQALAELGIVEPPIHNIHRWWRADVLNDLLLLVHAIREQTSDPDRRSFFELALAGVLVPDLTNVTLGRLQLHFIDKTDVEMSVSRSFVEHAKTMLKDLESLQSVSRRVPATVFNADAITAAVSTNCHPSIGCLRHHPTPTGTVTSGTLDPTSICSGTSLRSRRPGRST